MTVAGDYLGMPLAISSLDGENLEYFRQPQKLNWRQARWTTEMQEYNFSMNYKPGSQMTKADLLSRRAGHPDGKGDNEGVTLLPE